MKKLFLLITLCFSFYACETDFDITSEWQEIAVVYATLDQSESTQYIKINKVFLGEINALDAAQVTDSLYFPASMEVYMKTIDLNKFEDWQIESDNFPFNQQELDYKTVDVLQRVTLAQEGLEKEEGIFANNPAYVYKFDSPINQEYGYILEFTTPTGKTVKSYTPILEDLRLSSPNDEVPFDLQIANNKESWRLRWNQADNAEIFDVNFNLTYYETPKTGFTNFNTAPVKQLNWTPIRNASQSTNSVGTNFYEYYVNKATYYSFLNSSIEKNDEVIRGIGNFEIEIVAASEEMNTYINANANQLSASAGQVRPEYSNIINGIGIFTTTNRLGVGFSNFNNMEEWACEYTEITELNFAPPEGSSANWPYCQ